MSRSARLALALFLVGSAACGRKPDGAGATSSSSPPNASAAAAPPAEVPARAAPSATAPSLLPACRAVRVNGAARLGEAPLVSGALLDGSDWVTLEAGASVAIKHSTSARELAIEGPALFRACRKGREQVLLAKGTVVSTAGAGARPGAEVLIATPVASIRYADAELTARLSSKLLKLEVRTGQAEVDPASEGKPIKSPLRGKDTLALGLGKVDAVKLVARCQQAAEEAEASARRVADCSAPEPLGQRAQQHVLARKLARGACTIAAASTGLVADPAARAALWAEVLRWEGLWEAVPGSAQSARQK